MLQLRHPLTCKLTSPRSRKVILVACHSMTVSAAVAAAPHSRKVAVIGAGAAGLVSIRELLKEGHQVVGFEQGAQPGGTWLYDANTDSDLLGAAANRRRTHGSMYRDLRTNLPREIMGYSDAPLTPAYMGPASSDPRRYPGHAEVQSYLEHFAEVHQLHQHIQYNTQVMSIAPSITAQHETSSDHSSSAAGSNPSWQLGSVQLGDNGEQLGPPQEQVFDAVVVCNGHYSQPNLPEIPGSNSWPGQQLHSHNYRVPEAFKRQTVVVVGAANSGEDICREVSPVADQVIISARSWRDPGAATDPRPFGPRNNISRRGMVSALHPDGGVEFKQGRALPRADAIIYCTGYRYSFPFLEQHASTAHLSGQQHVPKLYQHMFVPELGHTLSFVGLPWKIVPFPQAELQAKLIARLLSGRVQLPPQPDMQASVSQHYKGLQDMGLALRYCHMMGESQWAYNNWLAETAGPDVQPLPAWRTAMYVAGQQNRGSHPEDYRDRWDDAGVAAVAEADLTRVLQQQHPSQQQQQKLNSAAATGVAA